MGDPVFTLPLLASVLGAGGNIFAGEQERKVAKYNANVEKQQADAVEKKTAYDVQLHREKVRSWLSAQRAKTGITGTDPSSGSPLDAMVATAKAGELDAMAIRYSGEVEAAKHKNAAEMYKMQGRNARTAGILGAGTSLLQGGSAYYNRKTRMR